MLQQPVSHHLKKLTEAGPVFAHRRQGPWTYCRVVPDALAGLAPVIAPATSTPQPAVEVATPRETQGASPELMTSNLHQLAPCAIGHRPDERYPRPEPPF